MRSRGYLSILAIVLAMLTATAVFMATRSPVLGLDLRGGSEIVLKAQPEPGRQLTPAMMDQAVATYQRRVNLLGTTEANIQKENGNEIVIQLPGEKNPARVESLIGATGKLYFIDLYGGLTPGISRSVVSSAASIAPRDGLYALLSAAQPLAHGQFSVYYAFDARHQVQTKQPSTNIPDLLQALGLTALPRGWTILAVPTGKLAVHCTIPKPQSFCPGPNGSETRPGTYWYMFDLPAQNQLLTGSDLTDARADVDGTSGAPIVLMTFNGHGGRIFQQITGKLAHDGKQAYNAAGAPAGLAGNYFRPFAIILDGALESYPIIDFTQNPDGIGPDTNGAYTSQITGVSSPESHTIADVLSSGSLPVSFIRLSETQISATLGKTSLRQGLLAGLAGLAVVMIYMIIFYRFLGLIADLALLIYAALFYGVILAIPVTLTLPGIAGLILTIGVAADANVVVFERIKEEVRTGKTVRAAIAGGYTKGFHTIIDANVVTLITAAVLFIASEASVKGFALLLAIGVVVSMFTAVAATRAMLGLLGGFRWFNNSAFMGASAKPVRWRFDFIGRRWVFFAISGAIIAIGLGSLATRGLNRGIDFTGGTRIQFPLRTGATVDQVRSSIQPVSSRLADAVVRGSGAASGSTYRAFEIDSKELTPQQEKAVEFRLEQRFGAAAIPPTAFNKTTVSASFGSQILRGAVIAFIFSMLLMALYLIIRFDWRYAVPTIAALVHDLLVTVGIYSLIGREVTSDTVAAVLTILGYSLYDTIIVFDRVRENERLLRKHTYDQLVNISLWETLTRSLNTSGITLLPILSLLLFGGSTLKDFAFALLVGIVSGAYSSFGIAAPILVALKNRQGVHAKRRGSDELPAVFRTTDAPAMATIAAVTPVPEAALVGAEPSPRPAPTVAPERPITPAEADAAAREAARRRRLEQRKRR